MGREGLPPTPVSRLPSFFRLKPLWLQFLLATLLLSLALGSALASSAARRMGDLGLSVFLAATALILAVIISLTVVPRLARAVNLSNLFMPVTFRITKAGMIFIGLVFLVAIAALNSGNNLLFLILALFLAAIIASGNLSRATLKGLSVTLQIPDIVYAETAVLLRVTLRNHKRFLPSFSLSVEGFRFDSSASWKQRIRQWLGGIGRHPAATPTSSLLPDHVYFPNIPARRSVGLSIVSRFPRRGKYSLDGFMVSTRFPFGFFKKGRRFEATGDLIVYPRPCEIGSFFHLLPFAEGHQENLYRGHGENLYSHRPYQLGDSVRSVDWKATAKLGDLMLKEYAKEDDRKVFICLDNHLPVSYSAVWAARFEQAVALAAGLSSHFIQEGAEVEFAVPDNAVPLRSGQQHLHRILELLALIQPVWDCPESEFRWPAGVSTDEGGLPRTLLDRQFKILLTSRPRGTIPSSIWRTSRVEFFSEL